MPRRRLRGIAVLIGSFVAVALIARLTPVPAETERLPPYPPAPAGVIEYVGRTSYGMKMVVWATRTNVAMRIDSGPTSRCREGKGLTSNYARGSVRRGGREFEIAGSFRTTALTTRGGGRLRLESRVPKRVGFRLRGKFTSAREASGSFERRDVIRDGARVELDCTRRSTWRASRATDG